MPSGQSTRTPIVCGMSYKFSHGLFSIHTYDKVSANTASSVSKTSKFQSGQRVVKMVLNT